MNPSEHDIASDHQDAPPKPSNNDPTASAEPVRNTEPMEDFDSGRHGDHAAGGQAHESDLDGADYNESTPHQASDPEQALDSERTMETESGMETGQATETRDEEMDRLRGEVEQANKRTLQAQAEAENFRKRMRRDYEDQLKFAALPLVTDILQVRDNLHRGIEAARGGGDTQESASGLTEGVAMVAKQLDDTLAKYHVKEIPAQGQPFDPNVHEAISQMPHAEIEAGHIVHVATTGYLMHDRVVRPAQVVVSTGAADS